MPRPNFFNDNVNRTFPFKKGSAGVGTPSTGPFTMAQLPDEFIADCGFIMGPESGFLAETNSVFLYRVARPSSNVFEFEFRSDATNLTGLSLLFTRSLSDTVYATEFLDSDLPPDISQSGSVSTITGECGEPYWSGYLVTGDMARIADRLSVGDEIIRSADDQSIVEPGLIQNLNRSQLVALGVANADRSRAVRPVDCPEYEYDFETGLIYVDNECFQGEVRLRAGYNLQITENDSGFTFTPLVNAGEGQPCEQVPLFLGETGPTNGNENILGGGFFCNEVFRTVNGVGGPSLAFFAGQGVSITGDQSLKSITIDINLASVLLCPQSDSSQS